MIGFLSSFYKHLLLHLEWAGGDRYWISTGARRYRVVDVLSMVNTVERFQADIRTGKPDAERAFETFKNLSKKGVAQLVEVCSSIPVYCVV